MDIDINSIKGEIARMAIDTIRDSIDDECRARLGRDGFDTAERDVERGVKEILATYGIT